MRWSSSPVLLLSARAVASMPPTCSRRLSAQDYNSCTPLRDNVRCQSSIQNQSQPQHHSQHSREQAQSRCASLLCSRTVFDSAFGQGQGRRGAYCKHPKTTRSLRYLPPELGRGSGFLLQTSARRQWRSTPTAEVIRCHLVRWRIFLRNDSPEAPFQTELNLLLLLLIL